MDFQNTTTDDLLAALPVGDEDDRWELKSAAYLDPQRRGDLKKELGKQVSAFANSGGGNLVFGISTTRQIEPCPSTVGRQTMKDFLATLVEQSVEYPIRDFRIHPVAISSDRTQFIYVIAINDSLAAPHQAKDERQYYYRIDGHSKAAPHFYVELLRSRYTKAVVEALFDGCNPSFLLKRSDKAYEEVTMRVYSRILLRNMSQQIAHPCGVRVCIDPVSQWVTGMHGPSLSGFELLQPDEKSPLFPTLTVPLNVMLTTKIVIGQDNIESLCIKAWNELRFTMQALSHNYAGPNVDIFPCQLIPCGDTLVLNALRQQMQSNEKAKERVAQTVNELKESMRRVGASLDIR